CTSGLFAAETGGSCAPAGSGTCYRRSLCGLDAAIHVSGGSNATITNNTLTNARIGVLVSPTTGAAAATVTGNTGIRAGGDQTLSADTSFSLEAHRVSEGMAASGSGATATFSKNTVSFTRFGIRTQNGATVHAAQNTVHDDYVSGVDVEDTSTLTASLNRF